MLRLFLAGGENDAEVNFDCTNDFTEMFCQFEQQHSNCTDHNVTFVLIDYSETTELVFLPYSIEK